MPPEQVTVEQPAEEWLGGPQPPSTSRPAEPETGSPTRRSCPRRPRRRLLDPIPLALLGCC